MAKVKERESPRSVSTNKKNKGRSRRRPLRGKKLIDAVKLEMGKMTNLSPQNKEDRINISNLAKRLKISRQAVYDNRLEREVEDFAALQRTNAKVKTEAAALRRPLEEQLKLLQKKVKELIEDLDGWVKRWTEVEYNAKMCGYDPDLLFAPIPPPLRKTLIFRRGRKKQ